MSSVRAAMAGAVALAGLASAVAADGAGGPLGTAAGVAPGTVVVACYRGPWEGVWWDRPEIAFTDSLRAVGFDFATSQAIGERICRDPSLVNDDAALQAAMEGILLEVPAAQRG